MEPYFQAGFGVRQMEQIRMALEMGLKADKFADPDFLANRMESLRRKEMVRLARALKLLPQGMTRQQITEVIYGLEQGVDVGVYADPSLSWRQMRETRRCLEAGIPADRLKGLGWKRRKQLLEQWKEEQKQNTEKQEESE